ncbi:MAPEG family protein [Wenxinia saemankumensis]|uniref:Uncharacterized conserved protein, MAPEG superfamily n=1 Tax=Wenxinia saemankumensis TaxID=1447782 RepID=A0A1M6ELW3_9RHOB|nr:MAPEG family protein [Wenxinia saemankumensis]SHI86511.1 Uncharacterized conserved protein, MAPEG superfamily [Wenxinia saemankumensis]
MTPELTVLALAALLQVVQFVLFAVPANMELGPGYTMSARDRAPSRPLSEGTGRLQRALNNHFEGLILFTIAVVVIVLGDKGTGFSAAMAWTYLVARVLYVPAYWLGLRPWRSLIWAVGLGATVAMLLSAFI